MVRQSDAVITTNHFRGEELTRRHGRNTINILANVPDRVDELVPLDPGYPPDRSILLYQGGIYASGRAFRETLRALTQCENLDFVVLGFGRAADLALLRRWAVEYGVSDRLHLLGARPFGELVHTAAAATIGLVPIKPLTLNETLGDTNKLHEYLMAGLPVVASDLPEIRRVVSEGSPPVGELFDPDDPESIASAIHRVLADPEEYKARAKMARLLALRQHNWQAQAHILDRVYERLLDSDLAR
jgi:glycosyltransferase involved in cell wall biosynthesis